MVVVKSGLDSLPSHMEVFSRSRGVLAVTNHTALNSELVHLTQVLEAKLDDRFKGVVAPEHGLYGQYKEGEEVGDGVDVLSGKPVYSWYSKTPGFREEWFEGVDTLVYDIQDGGVRHHTHVFVLRSAIEFCAKHGVRLVVLDRPNPIRGDVVQGNMPETTSIVCGWRIPIRYGLTPGELARLVCAEAGLSVDLEVVRLEGWRREMWFDQTGMTWVPLSPNTPTLTTSTLYPGTCLFEGTELSVGRGTTTPFEVIGSPWLDPVDLAGRFNSLRVAGVRCRPVFYTPRHSKYANQVCGGIHLHVTDRDALDPILASLHLLRLLLDKYGVERVFGSGWRHFDMLTGTERVRRALCEGADPSELVGSWQRDLEEFKGKVEGYTLYA